MAVNVIAFPRTCNIPSDAIEDQIERLIAILDERQASCEDMEPEPDFEEGGDAEVVNWPDWQPAKVVMLRRRSVSAAAGVRETRSVFVDSCSVPSLRVAANPKS
jgi:hypothetical protein